MLNQNTAKSEVSNSCEILQEMSYSEFKKYYLYKCSETLVMQSHSMHVPSSSFLWRKVSIKLNQSGVVLPSVEMT